jgi:hypothetical protein
MRRVLCIAVLFALAAGAFAVKAPDHVTAGQDATIQASGSVFVNCMGHVSKVKADGGSATIKGDDLQSAGRCVISDGDSSSVMWVEPAQPGKLNFLAQPTRVAAAKKDVISGTAFVFDKFNNLVTAPTPVKFELALEGSSPIVENVQAKNGVAWTRSDSSKKEGPANFTASVGEISVKRVVRQVASEACNIRMSAHPEKNGILVQTEPIRDCSGNALPDGTIVTFTSVDGNGKTTVDARIKKGIATAMLPAESGADISVASGVTVGNEIRWNGGGGGGK